MKAIEPTRTLPAKSLELFFDYTCPFAYLASTQARAVAAEMHVDLTYRPILLGGVFKAVGTEQNLFASLGQAKAAHNGADMQRWAKRFGVTLKMPPNHPMRSVDALRATLATQIDPKVIDAFYRAYWVDNRDISSHDVIASVVASAGHDADAIMKRLGDADIKDDLRKRTDEAIARGIFGVPTWIVDETHLYWGQDRIPFVIGEQRARPAPERKSDKTVEVFWDFSSPFGYLASTQLADLAARTGAKVVSRPILLGGLFRTIGTPDVPLLAMPEAKQRHVAWDIERWAARWGVPFEFPKHFPTNTVKALRLWYALPEARRDAFRDAVYRAYWAEGRDIGDEAVLAACVADEAVAKEALAKSGSDEIKSALRKTTDEAAARGVFGVPSFVVDGEVFWGQDRLDLVESALGA